MATDKSAKFHVFLQDSTLDVAQQQAPRRATWAGPPLGKREKFGAPSHVRTASWGSIDGIDAVPGPAEVELTAMRAAERILAMPCEARRSNVWKRLRVEYGERADCFYTVQGRESTFRCWPHDNNPRLYKRKMACAGFLFAPDAEARDKVLPRELPDLLWGRQSESG